MIVHSIVLFIYNGWSKMEDNGVLVSVSRFHCINIDVRENEDL